MLTREEKRSGVHFAFMPVIEDLNSDDSIITRSPEEIIKSSSSFEMPIIDGCNSGEGILSLFLMKGKFHLASTEPERFVPLFMGSSGDFDRVELGKEIRKFYFGDKPVDKAASDQLNDTMADNYFIMNSVINAEWIAKYHPKVPHYHYRFTYDGRFSLTKKLFNQAHVKGACHGDDVFYIFRYVEKNYELIKVLILITLFSVQHTYQNSLKKARNVVFEGHSSKCGLISQNMVNRRRIMTPV